MSILDARKNFAISVVSTGYSAVATSITLETGGGDKFPDPAVRAYNIVWWNSDEYPSPADDPNVEIVRVTAKAGDVLTVTRAQENTIASTKNNAGREYKVMLSPTAKMIDDIESALDGKSNISQFAFDPTEDDDDSNTGGNGIFTIGSFWLNTLDGGLWQTIDDTTGSAVWREVVKYNEDGDLQGIFIPRNDVASVIDGIALEDGELAVTTDTNEIRRGDGVTLGGIPIETHYTEGPLVDLNESGVNTPVVTIDPDGTTLSIFAGFNIDYTFKVTAYKIYNGLKFYYSTIQSNTVTSAGDGSPYSVIVNWDALAGADGYVLTVRTYLSAFLFELSNHEEAYFDVGSATEYDLVDDNPQTVNWTVGNFYTDVQAGNQEYYGNAINVQGNVNILAGGGLYIDDTLVFLRTPLGGLQVGPGAVGENCINFQTGGTDAAHYAYSYYDEFTEIYEPSITMGYDNESIYLGYAIGRSNYAYRGIAFGNNVLADGDTKSGSGTYSYSVGVGHYIDVNQDGVSMGIRLQTDEDNVTVGRYISDFGGNIMTGAYLRSTAGNGIAVGRGFDIREGEIKIMASKIDDYETQTLYNSIAMNTDLEVGTHVSHPSFGVELNRSTIIEDIVNNLGANIVSNAGITSDTWTKTSGSWSYSSFAGQTGYTLSSATGVLRPPSAITPVVGQRYLFVATIRHKASLNITCGGNTLYESNVSTLGYEDTFQVEKIVATFTATDTSNLSINVTAGGVGFYIYQAFVYPINGGDLTVLGNGMFGGTTKNAAAQVQIDSTTKGFLPPRMTTTQKNAISSPPAGLVVYDTTLNKLCVRVASAWETVTSA